MSPEATFWVVIAGVGLINYALRVSFIAVFAHREMPARMRHALRYVAPAVLAAIVVPTVVMVGGRLSLEAGNPRVWAALVGAAVAWRTRSPTWTIVSGMSVLWGLQALTD